VIELGTVQNLGLGLKTFLSFEEFSLQITNLSNAILILESLNGTGQRCGLAGTRRRHQVQKKDALFVKLLAK